MLVITPNKPSWTKDVYLMDLMINNFNICTWVFRIYGNQPPRLMNYGKTISEVLCKIY